MSNGDCPICNSGQGGDIERLRAEGLGYRRIVMRTEFGERVVRRHLNECDIPPYEVLSNDAADKVGGKSLDLDGDTGTINLNGTTEKITDYTKLLGMWDLDPEVFEVVEPVRMSTWESGDRQLYSYRARIQKKAALENGEQFDISGWRDSLIRSRPRLVLPVADGVTYEMKIADPQIGKKGTFESIDNWQRGVERHIDRIKRLSQDYKIHEVLIAFMGDEHEGVVNNYGGQPHTVEMNFSTQLETDLSLRIWTLRSIIDEIVDVDIKVSSVISNHGEFTRNGGKDPVTTKGDNSSTMIARMTKQALDGVAGYDHIDWHIAGGEPAVIMELSGVKAYYSHGYIEKGRGQTAEAKQVAAMNSQILGDPMNYGDIKVFNLAHFHHAWFRQDRNFTVFGSPALEARRSSEWMLEQYGVWSEPGMAGKLIGSAMGPTGWGEYHIF